MEEVVEGANARDVIGGKAAGDSEDRFAAKTGVPLGDPLGSEEMHKEQRTEHGSRIPGRTATVRVEGSELGQEGIKGREEDDAKRFGIGEDGIGAQGLGEGEEPGLEENLELRVGRQIE